MSVRTHLIAAVGRASEGQAVAWGSYFAVDLRSDFTSIADLMGAEVTVRRTNGAEEFAFPSGGRIWFFVIARGRGRRFFCDRLYVPDRTNADDLLDLTPSVVTSKDGTVVYY